MFKNPYPYYGNIMKSAENQIAVLKIKTDLDTVSIMAKQNNNKFSDLNQIKKTVLKEMMYSNIDVPDTWTNKSDYTKIGKDVLKDKKLLNYMKVSYPTEAIVEYNKDKRVTSNQVLKNHLNKIVPEIHPFNPKILKTEDNYENTIKEIKKLNPDAKFDLNLVKSKKDLINANIATNIKSSILKNKFENKDKEIIKKLIKNDNNIEDFYEKNEKYFKEKLVNVDNDESKDSDNEDDNKDLKCNVKNNDDIVNTNKIKRMYSFLSKNKIKKDNKKIIKKTNFDINMEAQNFMLKERRRNDNVELISEETKKHLELVQLGSEEKVKNLIELENKKNSSNYVKILNQMKSSIQNKDLNANTENSKSKSLLSFIINNQQVKTISSPKKNRTNDIENKSKENNENISVNNLQTDSPLKVNKKKNNEELMLTQSSFGIKTNNLMNLNKVKKKSNKSKENINNKDKNDEDDKKGKIYIIRDKKKNSVIVDQTEKVKHDLKPVSTYNKIKKIENYYPKICHKKIKNLVIEIKDHSSYGPYISICECCNKKNVEFYNKSNPNDAINILNHIMHKVNKKLS